MSLLVISCHALLEKKFTDFPPRWNSVSKLKYQKHLNKEALKIKTKK